MSEMERDTAKRLDSILSIMTPVQRAVLMARGEGMLEGYKLAKTEAQTIQPPQSDTRTGT